MATVTVTLSKFIGTISLGLLTGISYTHTTLTLPPILSLPTAQPAQQTYTHLRSLTHKHQLLLASLSSSTFLLAYALSPPRARHPFLLWATLSIGLGYSREIWGSVVGLMRQKKGGRVNANTRRGSGSESTSGDEEWEVAGGSVIEGSGATGKAELNGEVVREGMEKWKGLQIGRVVAFGVGWAVSVVGLWGDGFVGRV